MRILTLVLLTLVCASTATAQQSLSDEDDLTYFIVSIGIAATSYGAFLVSFFSDSFTYVETSFMTVILFSTCSPTNAGPQKMIEYTKYFISPFIDLDYEIAILCNIGVIVGGLLLHLTVAKLAQRSSGHTHYADVLGAVYCPSLSMVLVSHLFCGTFVLSVFVFSNLSFNSSVDVFKLVSSCIGIVFAVTVCVLWVLAIVAIDLSYKPHTTSNLLIPDGYYTPETSRLAFRNVVGMVREGGPMRLFLLSPLAVSAGMAVFFSIPSTDMSCKARFAVVTALVGIECILVFVLRPLRSLGLSIISGVAHVGLLALLVATLVETEDSRPSIAAKWVRIGGAAVVALCQLCSIFSHIYIGCSEVYPTPTVGEREPFQYRF